MAHLALLMLSDAELLSKLKSSKNRYVTALIKRFKEISSERNDAQCVLNGLGWDRYLCKKCNRRTCTNVYVCFNCGNAED